MFAPLYLSLKLALITTLLLWLVGLPLTYWVHMKSGKWRFLFKSLVSLPLVLPPTVLGYYLLLAFHPGRFPGSILEAFLGIQLAFSFGGLVVGAFIFSLPFMLNPIFSALENVPAAYLDASYTLGKSTWTTYWRVLLPNIRPALYTGSVMAFAHTMGEFGVVLMIGGNIPDKTRLASIAIYNEVESLDYATANTYSVILLALSFCILLSIYLYQSYYNRR